MSGIRGVPTNPLAPPSQLPTAPAAANVKGPTTVTRATGRAGDTTERVTSTPSPLAATGLEAPKPPDTSLLESTSAAARSFSYNLSDMGSARTNSDEMMLAFLKLQILEASRGNWMQMLTGAGRSTLRNNALDEMKNSDELGALAATKGAQADQANAKAEAELGKAEGIVSEAGIDPREVQRLYDDSVREGKKGDDVVDRYAAAHEGEEGLSEKLDALREAEPHYRQAAIAHEEGKGLEAAAIAIGGGESAWIMGAYATMGTRAGTEGMTALLANAEAQRNLANELMALLSGQRPDARARSEAMVEMDRYRNEVARLTLELIDKTSEAHAGGLRSFRS